MQRRIDRYEIVKEIGRGGMASVYHAIDPDSGRDVAVKVLPQELLHDRTFRRRFQREAQLVLAIEHPHIVAVRDFGESFGTPFVVMPYLTGGTLADRIRKGLDLAEIADVLDRIAAALDHAHAEGVIHRDVKPTNILFDDQGRAFLGDFGLVRLVEGMSDLTGSGSVGTPAYMAPELSYSGKVSPSVDIYALAATLFETLTGKPPFKGDTPIGTMVAHVTQPVPDLKTLRPGIPEGVGSVVQRGLAKSPGHRYPTAGAMARDFRAALTGHIPDYVPADSDTQPVDPKDVERELQAHLKTMGRQRRFDWRIAAGIGVLMLAVIIVSAFVLGRDGSSAGGEIVASQPVPAADASATPLPADTAAPTSASGFIGGGGQFIAFVSNNGGDDEIGLLSVKNFDQILLTNNQGIKDTSPAWSPDGSRIAFVSNRDSGFEIYLMDADGSNVTRLTDRIGDDLYPAWSPDGTKIAFASDRNGGDLDIFVMDVPPPGGLLSEPVAITHNGFQDLAPAWSPDGTLIVYSTYEEGNGDIAIIPVAGGQSHRLAPNANEDLSPAWSPDGQWIAFASNREKGQWDIYIMRPDGSDLRNLTNNPDYDGEPYWSPDAQWIVFSSGTFGKQRLVMIHPTGGGLVELTVPAAFYFDLPTWQPVTPP